MNTEALPDQDQDPTSKDAYRRMFHAACEDLGAIAQTLGINTEFEGGAQPILESIEALRKLAGHADMHVFQMDDVEWWIGPTRWACLTAQADWQDRPVDMDAAAEDAPHMTDAQLAEAPFHDDAPEGRVIRTFAEQLAIERAAGGEFPRLFASTDF